MFGLKKKYLNIVQKTNFSDIYDSLVTLPQKGVLAKKNFSCEVLLDQAKNTLVLSQIYFGVVEGEDTRFIPHASKRPKLFWQKQNILDMGQRANFSSEKANITQTGPKYFLPKKNFSDQTVLLPK